MRLMVSDWMLNWRILLSPGLSLYCLHWPEGASADAAQRMHNRSFITTCSQKKNPWTAKPFLVELKTSSNGKTRPFAVGDSQCAGEGARGDGESSGEVAQYNAQARWRRRWADQSLLCPLNYFFKRVRGQVVFCREASLFVIMMLPVLPFLWYFSMSSEALDSTPRLEVNLDEEGLVHTRALGLALALLSGVLMTVYSRCPRTIFMFSELWTCHL